MIAWLLKYEAAETREDVGLYLDKADAKDDFLTEAAARFSPRALKYANVRESADGALTLVDGYASLELVPMEVKGRLPILAPKEGVGAP